MYKARFSAAESEINVLLHVCTSSQFVNSYHLLKRLWFRNFGNLAACLLARLMHGCLFVQLPQIKCRTPQHCNTAAALCHNCFNSLVQLTFTLRHKQLQHVAKTHFHNESLEGSKHNHISPPILYNDNGFV